MRQQVACGTVQSEHFLPVTQYKWHDRAVRPLSNVGSISSFMAVSIRCSFTHPGLHEVITEVCRCPRAIRQEQYERHSIRYLRLRGTARVPASFSQATFTNVTKPSIEIEYCGLNRPHASTLFSMITHGWPAGIHPSNGELKGDCGPFQTHAPPTTPVIFLHSERAIGIASNIIHSCPFRNLYVANSNCNNNNSNNSDNNNNNGFVSVIETKLDSNRPHN